MYYVILDCSGEATRQSKAIGECIEEGQAPIIVISMMLYHSRFNYSSARHRIRQYSVLCRYLLKQSIIQCDHLI